MVSGTAAAGKTSMFMHVIPLLIDEGIKPAAAKMDCFESGDKDMFSSIGIPSVLGLSGDICPDHFLVSNLPELWNWAERKDADYLFIESAGLCHRCSPITEKSAAIAVIDATANAFSPGRMGPIVTGSDLIVLSKCDLISQAEREILMYRLKKINPRVQIIAFDGREVYGSDRVRDYILQLPLIDSYENDTLRHSMPSGVCSYCVGERRVGSAFQLGVVGKIDFGSDS